MKFPFYIDIYNYGKFVGKGKIDLYDGSKIILLNNYGSVLDGGIIKSRDPNFLYAYFWYYIGEIKDRIRYFINVSKPEYTNQDLVDFLSSYYLNFKFKLPENFKEINL